MLVHPRMSAKVKRRSAPPGPSAAKSSAGPGTLRDPAALKTPARLRAWLAYRSQHGGAWFILAFALFLRLSHWFFVRRADPFYAHTIPETDMHTYWEWAKSIAHGDWLSRQQGAFYYGPLYPYFLAPIFSMFGPNFDLVHLAHAAIGAFAPVALWAVGRELFGPVQGLFAGLLAAACAPILFYEQLLLMEGLLVTIHAGFLWAVVRGINAEHRPWRFAALAGWLAALACLGRGNFLLVAVLFGGIWWLAERLRGVSAPDDSSILHRPSLSRWGIPTLAYTLAFCLVIGASTLRNGLVGHQWVLTTSNGPILFYIGNAPDSMGVFHYPDSFFALEKRYGDRGAVPWGREAVVAIARDPLGFVGRFLRKLAIFLNSYEVADNANYYLLGRASPIVRWNPIGWQLLLALGTAGAWLTRKHWRKQLVLYLYAASFALSIVLIFVVGRYRLEFLLPLALWSGGAAAELLVMWEQRRWRQITALATWCVFAFAAAAPRWSPAVALNSPPGVPGTRLIRANDYVLCARAFLETGHPDEALAMLVEGFRVHPWDQSLARNLAAMLAAGRRLDEAVDTLERYLLLVPTDVEIGTQLAQLYAQSGQPDRAAALAARIVEVQPDNTTARKLLQKLGSQRSPSDQPPPQSPR